MVNSVRPCVLRASTCVLACLAFAAPAFAVPSDLWGVSGERFDPHDPLERIMDWSFAGYHAGEAPLPDLSPTANVTDYGAAANDMDDDTDAFLDAIAAASESGGVVSVPAGEFIISRKLKLTNGVVLQGAGRSETILKIPFSLTEAYGPAVYSYEYAFIEARGSLSKTVLSAVSANASRGGTSLQLTTVDGIQVGQWIRIQQTDVEGALMDRLQADLLDGGSFNTGKMGMDFPTRVKAIHGFTIEIERTLPVDVDTRWSPQILVFNPRDSELGVEHLTIAFPCTPYPGHFNEQGYNAIDFSSVAHSWVRDIEIQNADFGINIRGSFFVTVQDVTLTTTGDRGTLAGHHGLNNGHGGDNLFVGFDIQTTFFHDLTNEWYATGVVFTKGRGKNLRMDHHTGAPYSTLWTELDTGAGTKPFLSGGDPDRGPHTAAYDTLWNVRASADMKLPENNFGPRMNFIGFQTAATEVTSPNDWWFEKIAPDVLEPPNLWEAMRAHRLGAADAGVPADDAPTGVDAVDASVSDASGSDGSLPDSGADDALSAEGGCACRAAQGTNSAWLLAGVALAAAWVRRSGKALP